MGEEADNNRKVVKTYIPAYQKQEWREHASTLDMSQSEFVRSMVQAGRRGFGADAPTEPTDQVGVENDDEQHHSSGEDPGGQGLQKEVLDVLQSGTHSWEELVDAVIGELETELDETLQELQTEGQIRYSGRDGGYELMEEP